MKRRSRKKGRPRGRVVQHGRWWWAKFAVNGERVAKRSNVPADDPEGRELAEKFLVEELAKADLHRGAVVRGRLKFEQLGELLRQDYLRQGRRSLDRAERSLKQLAAHFAGKTVEQIGAGLDGYVDARLAVVKSGTVRLEVAALKRAFALAAKRKLVASHEVPAWPTLAAGEARQGFVEREDFERVACFLPDDVKGAAWLAYFTGMRRSEVLGLRWADVDRHARTISLVRTKNGKRRLIAYGQLPELVALVERRHQVRLQTGAVPWVFHRGGEPVRSFRDAWTSACEKAGVPGLLFHDLRRSAIRNFVRAGVPDAVSMAISGHRTRSVFDRYNIVNESDISKAFGALAHSSSTTAEREEAQDGAGGGS